MPRPDVTKPLSPALAIRLFLHEFGAVTLWSCAAHAVFFLSATPLLHDHVPRLADQTPLAVFSAGLVVLFAVWDATGLWLDSPINPVMTLSLLLSGRITPRAAGVLASAQFVANAFAAGAARAVGHIVATDFVEQAFSPPAPAPGVGFAVAVAFECAVTMVFCLVMLSLDDMFGKDDAVRRFALTSSLFVVLMQVGAEWTGSVMNPALTTAFALLSGKWSRQAVYWMGPGLGSVLAAQVVNLRERRKRGSVGATGDGDAEGEGGIDGEETERPRDETCEKDAGRKKDD